MVARAAAAKDMDSIERIAVVIQKAAMKVGIDASNTPQPRQKMIDSPPRQMLEMRPFAEDGTPLWTLYFPDVKHAMEVDLSKMPILAQLPTLKQLEAVAESLPPGSPGRSWLTEMYSQFRKVM